MSAFLLVVSGIASAVVAIGALTAFLQLQQAVLAAMTLLRRGSRPLHPADWQVLAGSLPEISIIVPAHNEAETITTSITALLGLEYPSFEVIVVDDGSRDDTSARLVGAFAMVPDAGWKPGDDPVAACNRSPDHRRLLHIRQAQSGKAGAINTGLRFARGSYVSVIDADSILERTALLRLARAVADHPGRVLAAGGSVRIANGSLFVDGTLQAARLGNEPLVVLQTLEYLRGFHLARTGLAEMGCLALVSGAFGLFHRDALIAAGGYRADTVGEDFEMVVRLRRLSADRPDLPDKVLHYADAVCWTQAPDTLAMLARQRARWQRGALQTLWLHRRGLLEVRKNPTTAFALWEAVMRDVLTPPAEALGYLLLPLALWMGWLSPVWFASFLVLSLGMGLLQSAIAIAVEDIRFRRLPAVWASLKLGAAAFLEGFGYRQLCTVWRLQGIWQALRGQHGWGAMPRKAFATAPVEQAP